MSINKNYAVFGLGRYGRAVAKELVDKGENPDLEQIKKDIEERDYRDSHRAEAPLKQADDAVLVDSSDMSIDEVTQSIIDIINSKVN